MADKRVNYELTAEDKFTSTFDRLKGKLGDTESHFRSFVKFAAGSAGFAAVTATMAAMTKAADDAMQANLRLEAVMKATGNISGFTSGQIQTLADRMAMLTEFDDEGFKNATAAILRFGDVSGNQLTRLLKLSADYAKFTGGDLVSSAEMLGKAVASPTQGIERLQRQVGYLTQSQKDSVKAMQESGDMIGAQAKMLEILEGKIGGTAETMNQGFIPATKNLAKAITELMEIAGTKGEDSYATMAVKGLTAALTGMKNVIEDGDWIQTFKDLTAFMMVANNNPAAGLALYLGREGVRTPKGDVTPNPAGDAAVQQRAESEALIAQQKKLDEELAKLNKEYRDKQKKAAEEWAKHEERMRDLDAKGWVAYAQEVFDESDRNLIELAKISEAYWENEDKLKKKDIEGWVAYAQAVFDAADEENRALAKASEDRFRADQERWSGFLGGIEGAFRQTWDAFGGGAKNAAQVARDALKRTLFDWLYQALAKPFIMSIVASGASAMGMSGLANAAGAGGGGGMGDYTSLASGLGGLGSAAASLFGTTGAATSAGLAIEGIGTIAATGTYATAGLAATGGVSAGMMSSLAALGPYAAIAIALYAAYQAFKDKGENWSGQIGFGPNANAYSSTGSPFGAQGFEHIAGQNETNVQLQAFMAGFDKLDHTLASTLSPEAIARIQENLAAYGAHRVSQGGTQPAEFAFGKDDQTAMSQFTLEYLQAKYSVVFDEIDTKFADFVRTYTGTAEELATQIGTFAQVLDEISQSPITGLNVDILRSWQQQGEALADTLKRVNGYYSQYYDLFYTEEEKKLKLQEQLNAAFKTMNLEVPTSMEAYRTLVESLDLSTESGQKFYQFLLQMAPAFAQLGSSITSTTSLVVAAARSVADVTLTAWQESQRSNQLALDKIKREQQALADAKSGLIGYLQGLLQNTSLSPLSLQDRYGQAQTAYQDILAKARGGDLTAMQNLGGASDTMLALARQLFGSSGAYNAIFTQTFDAIKGVVGGGPSWQASLTSALPKQGQIMSSADAANIVLMLKAIANGNTDMANQLADAIAASGSQVAAAVAPGTGII